MAAAFGAVLAGREGLRDGAFAGRRLRGPTEAPLGVAFGGSTDADGEGDERLAVNGGGDCDEGPEDQEQNVFHGRYGAKLTLRLIGAT